jgi:hypothetical protein
MTQKVTLLMVISDFPRMVKLTFEEHMKPWGES